MDWILNLIPGGSLTAILAAVFAGIAAIGTLLYKTKQAGVNQQKVKEADAYAKSIKDIENAGNARPIGLPDDDPNNRDRP
jgi:hypothetical protein